MDEVVERFKALREKVGSGVDIGVEFHGAVQPPTAMTLMKALEPTPNRWFLPGDRAGSQCRCHG